MAESIWITTTTLPDGTFDFFRFAALLQTATLLELHMELIYAETCADEYGSIADVCYGAEKEEMTAKAILHNSLWALIDNEIFIRGNPEFMPKNSN